MDLVRTSLYRLELQIARRLGPHQERLTQHGIDLLRLSLGVVFLLFGLLKFVPGLSPAADLATQAMDALTFGLLPDWLGLALVALLETAIGLTLLTGRYLRLGLLLLLGAMGGILSPLVLVPDELFAGPFLAPTLEGQYVIKDIVLLAAALLVTVNELARPPATIPTTKPARRSPATSRPRFRLDLDAGGTSHG